eukprot:7391556-Prymnesium_polylepis.1
MARPCTPRHARALCALTSIERLEADAHVAAVDLLQRNAKATTSLILILASDDVHWRCEPPTLIGWQRRARLRIPRRAPLPLTRAAHVLLLVLLVPKRNAVERDWLQRAHTLTPASTQLREKLECLCEPTLRPDAVRVSAAALCLEPPPLLCTESLRRHDDSRATHLLQRRNLLRTPGIH